MNLKKDIKMLTIKEDEDGVSFKIRVQPKSSATEIYRIVNDTLKIRVAAPPYDDKANMECISFLAKKFDIPKASVEILYGNKSREKLIKIYGIKKDELVRLMGI